MSSYRCLACDRYMDVVSCMTNQKGEHHSYNDEPSLVFGNGTNLWHKDGKIHRETGPAEISVRRYKPPTDYIFTERNWFWEGKKVNYRYLKGDIEVGKPIEFGDNICIVLEQLSRLFYRIMIGDDNNIIILCLHSKPDVLPQYEYSLGF